MKIRILPGTLLPAACLAALLAGCGQSAAPRTVPPTPRPQATPIPNDLVAYAASVDPTVKTTIQEGDNLLSQMQQHDMSAVANACVLAGGDFANYQTAFHLGYAPSGASAVSNDGTAGYKLILAATDECGMAADSSSKSQMSSAWSDLRHGLGLLGQAESTMAPWDRAKL